MDNFTPLASTLGGVLLGLACSALFLLNGRILGISGIVGEIPVVAPGDRAWRVVFIVGLLTGGVAVLLANRSALAFASEQTIPIAIVAGLLVGFGTRLGNGCTSGHGLCGLARLSKRSLVATLIFFSTGAVTVFLMRHVLFVSGGAR